MSVRTRFAPSPTGRLHLGNLRVAAFNWLFARHHGGAFVLRIEDTDLERNLPGAVDAILEDLSWLGLAWDEGPGVDGPHSPYRQSGRAHLYREAAQKLLAQGRAYPCWCTDEELEGERKRMSGGDVLRYSGRCRRLSASERAQLEASGRASAIRFEVPEATDAIEIEDEVRGLISFPYKDISDFVILRNDGRPTYNFAVVADDVDMEITHVIRGAGHLSNTPRQALLFDALGNSRPRFAHLPTVLAPEGGKLSKRLGAAAAATLREEGFHPDGVVNYLSLLGWSSADEREVLGRDELVERVSLERVGKSDTTYDPEKLRWLSAQHIARMEVNALVASVSSHLDRSRFPLQGDALGIAVDTVRSRLTTFGEIDEHLTSFYPDESVDLQRAREQVRNEPDARRVLQEVAVRLQALEVWTPDSLRSAVRDAGKATGARGPALFHPLRKAVSGEESGPALGGILGALGRAEVMARIARTLDGHEV